MNLKLFRLIHNERPYKRYYYEPLLNKRDKVKRFAFFFELKQYAIIFMRAVYLPFNNKYNVQQFPGKRKSKVTMLWENVLWAFKYKEVNTYYFLYGLDLKSRNPKDYVAYTEFRVLRNILNFRQRENLRTKYTFNYLALTRDKFVFYQYCKSLNFPYPKLIALVSNGQISWCNDNRLDFEDLAVISKKNFKAFCKEINGESGIGAFVLEINNGDIFIQGKKATLNDIKRRLAKATFLIQEKLNNHPDIENIYSKSLNTLKLITILNQNGEVEFFDSVIRFGANGSFVDNASQGGIFVGISEDGYLQEVGYHEPGIKSNLIVNGIHPDTGKRFGGMKLPYWDELLAEAKRFHKFFYGVPSIGWDVAITPDRFVFTETGEDWEIPVYQVTNGGKRKEFYRTHGQALKIQLRKY